jgi:hypothetical protein
MPLVWRNNENFGEYGEENGEYGEENGEYMEKRIANMETKMLPQEETGNRYWLARLKTMFKPFTIYLALAWPFNENSSLSLSV